MNKLRSPERLIIGAGGINPARMFSRLAITVPNDEIITAMKMFLVVLDHACIFCSIVCLFRKIRCQPHSMVSRTKAVKQI